MNVKELLRNQLLDAYSGDDEMSLQASLRNLDEEEAAWRMNATTWTIAEILYHLYSCEIEYCKQGFGRSIPYGKPLRNVEGLMDFLDQAHELLMGCLRDCPETALDQPIPTQFHGESAAHFFWIMVMHRVSHAAQIRTIRRAYSMSLYPNPNG